jgi:hypothetical protein
MLTWGDDYPIHQTPEPVAFAGSDRNFYDRYFFNGQSADGSLFFAAALGVYPHLDVIDAAFCLLIDGRQHNIRASRRLNSERMDLRVGPIEVRILEPLKRLGLIVSANDGAITANLSFDARHAPIEEPRFIRRNGPRLFMDYTRMTQNGAWSGELAIKGQTHRLDARTTFGTRDRSWGIRPVGAPDSQPAPAPFQFFWLWAPFNFADRALFLHTNDDDAGQPWNRRAVIDAFAASRTEFERPAFTLRYQPGTRRIRAADITLGESTTLLIEPTGANFYMSGLGYMHPTWGHGRDHGALETAHDVIDATSIDDNAPGQMHIQALARATLTDHGKTYAGAGVLEQLLIGPHAPSGFTSMLDPAP